MDYLLPLVLILAYAPVAVRSTQVLPAELADDGLLLFQGRSSLASRSHQSAKRSAFVSLLPIEGTVTQYGLRDESNIQYPGMVDGVNITKEKQELVPMIGACYWPEASLQDAVLLYRQRASDAALARLRKTQGLEALHMTINVAQMSDRYDIIDLSANAILQTPGNAMNSHALFVKALYGHASNDTAVYQQFSNRLRIASPSAWVALDRAVSDVALAWDSRAYPPYTPVMLPKGWTPTKLAIVVFGCPVNDDGTPQPCLAERLDATLTLTAAFPAAQILTSGGAVSSKHPEGAFIRDWLVRRGVASSRIFVDTSARDTLGNCIYVANWLRANKAGNAIIVTSTWHSPRARLNLQGLLEQYSVVASVVSVGAGRSSYPTQAELDQRLILEYKASHRDAARARGLFSACDF